jgi:hypothetical protein
MLGCARCRRQTVALAAREADAAASTSVSEVHYLALGPKAAKYRSPAVGQVQPTSMKCDKVLTHSQRTEATNTTSTWP